MNDNIIRYDFKKKDDEEGVLALTCGHCGNKTFVLLLDEPTGSPQIFCAFCETPWEDSDDE